MHLYKNTAVKASRSASHSTSQYIALNFSFIQPVSEAFIYIPQAPQPPKLASRTDGNLRLRKAFQGVIAKDENRTHKNPGSLGRKSAALSILDCWISSAALVSSRRKCWRDLTRELSQTARSPRGRLGGQLSPCPARTAQAVPGGAKLPGANLVGTFSAGTASAWPPSYSHQLLTVCFSFAIGFRGSGANKVRAVLILKADVCF